MISLFLVAVMGAYPLPSTPDVAPLEISYFPTRMHCFVFKNWGLAPLDRMASVTGATPEQIQSIATSMGLPTAPTVSEDQWRRSYITVIRRNWHLLPYDQLQALLGFSEEELAFTLQEDDFLYVKLGLLKPKCAPLKYEKPTAEANARAKEIAAALSTYQPAIPSAEQDPLFGFVRELSAPVTTTAQPAGKNLFTPRYCYSYFALYGDPLLEPELEPYPDAYLERLAQTGVSGVWLQAVLYKLAPFPWEPALSDKYEQRLKNLDALVQRAKKHGIGVYLYLNEPRTMANAFFDTHPKLKGVTEGDRSTLCVSTPEVQEYLASTIESICKAVPDLAGFFTISGSENLTNCWSHYQGMNCPNCKDRGPAATVAQVNISVQDGIDRSGAKTKLIAWDWGWQDEWAVDAINHLPKNVMQMSVSEWSLPITRGGVDSAIGEYSISAIGPGPRATKHWAAARDRGMQTMAKIQAGTTWELGSVPYIPAVRNVAQHIANLRDANVNGMMLGWTLGGYPSPNLEVVAAMGSLKEDGTQRTVDEALVSVAGHRFGAYASAVVKAWNTCSTAFSEYPYNGAVVYNSPHHGGPSNPLFETPTKYRATMVGIPYDDLPAWRGGYPEDVYIGQFRKVSDGFFDALKTLREDTSKIATLAADIPAQKALAAEASIMETCAIHYRSAANQARFVVLRDAVAKADAQSRGSLLEELKNVIEDERAQAIRLYELQQRDSRIGFEASNHYFFVPQDLLEKIVNCEFLLNKWLPGLDTLN